MRLGIWCVLLGLVVVVQCNDLSFLNDLKSLDFVQIFKNLFVNKISEFDGVTTSPLTGRTYDWDKCVIEFGEVFDGLSKTEFWAMQLVDSWGKIPSSVLTGNFYELGSFTECLNLKRNGEKYQSQYCLAMITVNTTGMMPNGPQPKMAMPAPGSNAFSLGLGMCYPQSCSPEALTRLINETLPANVTERIAVHITEDQCQFEEIPSEFRTIDWITIGLLLTVLCLMIVSTCYDIYCTINEKPKARLLMAFSVYTNGRSLLSAKRSKSKDTMDCVHGIRVFSTQWVVLGHTYMMYLFMPTRNSLGFMMDFMKQYHSMYMMSAMISVDTFFMLSGLFVSYTMLKHMEKTRGRINIPVLYLHRYLRLTPLLAVNILILVSVFRYITSGPRWPFMVDMLSGQCEVNWWKTLLYVQNYVNPENICFGHSWYLAVDMQLFLISPFVVYGIYRYRVKFLYVLSIFVWLCVGCTITIFEKLDYAAEQSQMGQGPVFNKTYYPTHLRYAPWLVGLIFGALLLESRKHNVRIPRKINLGAWLVTFALLATVIFANYPLMQPDIKSTNLEYALYVSLSRIAWAIALSYIIYACVHGYGGPVNWFLSLSIWQPLSRLSYAIYIVHFPVLMIVMGSAKSSFVISEFYAYHYFLGNYVLTVLVSIVFSLAFESPIVIIEKMIFGGGGGERRNE